MCYIGEKTLIVPILLSAAEAGFGCADAGRWAANRAILSLMVAESMVFCRLKLLLLQFKNRIYISLVNGLHDSRG